MLISNPLVSTSNSNTNASPNQNGIPQQLDGRQFEINSSPNGIQNSLSDQQQVATSVISSVGQVIEFNVVADRKVLSVPSWPLFLRRICALPQYQLCKFERIDRIYSWTRNGHGIQHQHSTKQFGRGFFETQPLLHSEHLSTTNTESLADRVSDLSTHNSL